MTRKRDREELAGLFDSLAEDARAGDVTDVFIVLRGCDGSYDSCFKTDDLGDLLLQVRTEIIRAQLPTEAAGRVVNHGSH